jgi:hypothetical protein
MRAAIEQAHQDIDKREQQEREAAAAEAAVQRERDEVRKSLTEHWLTRLHDQGDPAWWVPAYDRATDNGRFANRVVRIGSWSAASRIDSPWDWLPAWAQRLYVGTRKRAGVRGVKFDLKPSAMLYLVWRSEGLCEVSGLPFDLAKAGPKKWRPFAPSLDRIDPAGHYRIGNLRLVCLITNVAMHGWGEQPLRTLAKALLAKPETHAEHGGNKVR